MSPDSALFDTNAFIAWSGDDKDFRQRFPHLRTPLLAFASVGELYHGVYKSSRVVENLKALGAALRSATVIYADEETTILFGRLMAQTKQRGRSVDANDLWIAALALQHQLPLLTRDTDFASIEGLEPVSW